MGMRTSPRPTIPTSDQSCDAGAASIVLTTTQPRNAAEGKAECSAGTVASTSDELEAADGHEESARAHHDGKGGSRIHTEEADENHTGRIQANAELHEGTKDGIGGDGEPEFTASESESVTSGRSKAKLGSEH